jgi:GGDEF domain-containing protein
MFLYSTNVPNQKTLQRLLRRVVQRISSEDARDLPVFVLVEDDVAVVLDEAALRERAVQRAERVLRNISKDENSAKEAPCRHLRWSHSCNRP